MTDYEYNPGSPEARENNCVCPILDNRHGKGAYNGPEGSFIITMTCPLHGDMVDEETPEI